MHDDDDDINLTSFMFQFELSVDSIMTKFLPTCDQGSHSFLFATDQAGTLNRFYNAQNMPVKPSWIITAGMAQLHCLWRKRIPPGGANLILLLLCIDSTEQSTQSDYFAPTASSQHGTLDPQSTPLTSQADVAQVEEQKTDGSNLVSVSKQRSSFSMRVQ